MAIDRLREDFANGYEVLIVSRHMKVMRSVSARFITSIEASEAPDRKSLSALVTICASGAGSCELYCVSVFSSVGSAAAA